MAFCEWLTKVEREKGQLKPNEIYRLPTDTEWSTAAGMPEENGATPEARDLGNNTLFSWGTAWPPPHGAGNYAGEETRSEVKLIGYRDDFEFTSPVGSFQPNALGLFDMGGNVWQWTLDDFNGSKESKTLRGGSWYNGGVKPSLLLSCRYNAKQDATNDTYGFRIVKASDLTHDAKPASARELDDADVLPGDSLEVQVAVLPEFTERYVVRRGGYIIAPQIGRVMVAGMKVEVARTAIRDAIAKSAIAVGKDVLVELRRYRGIAVESGVIYLSGEVTSPRPWSVPKGTPLNLLAVLRAGGGWTEKADITRVKVVRMRNSEPTTRTENLQEIIDGKQADVPLQNGDVIVVPPLGGDVEIITSGSVRSK